MFAKYLITNMLKIFDFGLTFKDGMQLLTATARSTLKSHI